MINYIILPLGELLANYDREKIEAALSLFRCAREHDLETFLAQKAIHYEEKSFGRTYLCLDQNALEQGTFKIMAYFTVSHTAVQINELKSNKRKKVMGEYPGRDNLDFVPAFLIGQLGRSDEYSKDDLSGDVLLKECYHIFSVVYHAIGGKLLILECREWMFSKFYEKHGFKKLYDELDQDGLYTLYQKIDFDEYFPANQIK